MKTALIIAAAMAAFSLPAFAQGTASGTSAGGPARVGPPGQIGGGVPGTRPNVVEQRMVMPKRTTKKKRARKMM